jgi:hypothetical protein
LLDPRHADRREHQHSNFIFKAQREAGTLMEKVKVRIYRLARMLARTNTKEEGEGEGEGGKVVEWE